MYGMQRRLRMCMCQGPCAPSHRAAGQFLLRLIHPAAASARHAPTMCGKKASGVCAACRPATSKNRSTVPYIWISVNLVHADAIITLSARRSAIKQHTDPQFSL